MRQAVQELGWRAAVLHAADLLLRRLHAGSGVVCYRFLAQPLRTQPRLPAGRARHFSFRLLHTPQMDTERVLHSLGRPAAVIAARFAQGAQCLLATREGRLAGCIWFAAGMYAEDEVAVDYVLPARCVWDFDVYVAPAERLGFLFAGQWDALDALLLARGLRCSLSRVNALNRHSLASHRSLGAVDRGWALFVRLGASQLMLSGLAPYVAWGGRPRLRMRADVD